MTLFSLSLEQHLDLLRTTLGIELQVPTPTLFCARLWAQAQAAGGSLARNAA